MPTLTVSGTVHFAQQRARMTELYFARKTRDDGPVLAVYFSDHPLPLALLDDRTKLAGLARKEAFVGLYAEIQESGNLITTELLYADGSFSGPWTFEPTKGKRDRLAGTISTDGEQEFFGKAYAVNVKFVAGPTVDDTWRGSPFYETKPTGLAVGRAEGWMEREGKKTSLSYALAVSETDLFGDSGERKLFLSAAPLTEKILAGPMGPEQALHEAGIAFLRVGLDSKHEIQSVMVPSAEGNPINFSSNQWSIELAAGAERHFDGRVELNAAKQGDSDFPRFDLRFHATTVDIGAMPPVTAANGKPLPKDGGEPAKAYRAFLVALKKAKSVEELLPLRIEKMNVMITAVPVEHRAGLLEFLKAEAQTQYKIVGGFVNEDQATLWLERKTADERIEGRVNVHRENDAWKLGLESFRSQPQAGL